MPPLVRGHEDRKLDLTAGNRGTFGDQLRPDVRRGRAKLRGGGCDEEQGKKDQQKTKHCRRHLRHCEPQAKQSDRPSLDCFAKFAMTN
jgi:hypothetical protein